MFEYAIEVLKNELYLQNQDYDSFAMKKTQDACMRKQIQLTQAISILEKAGKE